ncbi:MAG: acetate--CoA ligase family protein, partial [Candidatus Bathyarchaeia archaeon]
KILEYFNFPVIKTAFAASADEAVTYAKQMGYPVALKIASPQIIYKANGGGVILNVNSDAEVRQAFERIMQWARESYDNANILGVTIQPMVRQGGYEVIIGGKKDPTFGPAILFGMGGVGAELFKDYSIGLPPLNTTLIRRMLEETKVYQLLKGYKNFPPANLKLLEEILLLLSQLLIDFPQLKEVDIPIYISEKEALILDAKMAIDKEAVFKKFEPHEHLVISPYPKNMKLYGLLETDKKCF